MPLGFGKILTTDALSTEPDLYQALKTALAEFTLRTLLHRGGERKGALEHAAPAARTSSVGGAVPLASARLAMRAGNRTRHREPPGHWGCWSVAQLNLNENCNDSSGLGSMGQRVPWPPRYKRSISGENAGAHCVPAPHRARGSSYFGAEGTNASGESRTWTSTNMSSTLHHQCPPRHNNNGNKNTAAALVGVLNG